MATRRIIQTRAVGDAKARKKGIIEVDTITNRMFVNDGSTIGGVEFNPDPVGPFDSADSADTGLAVGGLWFDSDGVVRVKRY